MRTDRHTRLARCLRLLRADRSGSRQLTSSRRMQLMLSGMHCAGSVLLCNFAGFVRAQAERQLVIEHQNNNAITEVMEAGHVVRALLAGAGSHLC